VIAIDNLSSLKSEHKHTSPSRIYRGAQASARKNLKDSAEKKIERNQMAVGIRRQPRRTGQGKIPTYPRFGWGLRNFVMIQ